MTLPGSLMWRLVKVRAREPYVASRSRVSAQDARARGPVQVARGPSRGDITGALECLFERVEDVVATDLVDEARVHQYHQRLGEHLAENDRGPRLVSVSHELAQRVQAGRVHRRYVTHPHDERAWLRADLAEHVAEALCGAEEERPVDLVQDDSL